MSGAFMFGMFRRLNDDDRQELIRILADLGITASIGPLPGQRPLPELPGPLLPEAPGNALHGDVPMGPVTITWVNGVPVHAVYVPNPVRNAAVPAQLWAEITAVWHQDYWMPAVYVAFLESDFREGVKNPSDAEESWGAFQVNRRAHGQYSVEYLTTYAGNVRAAWAIFNNEGWGAWWNSAGLLGLPR